ncbi:MAG: methyltransferase domain-containing protein [Hyphomonas sp.]|nr:methyltransferase domain-containing protein [Hyphomonas sp.]
MVTEDTVYQGRVHLVQPETGFRTGTDSLLLAAALSDKVSYKAMLDVGCGCGGALLPAVYRVDCALTVGVDIVDHMVDLARAGIARNGFSERVRVEQGEASAWVKGHENAFDLVFSNPPYFEPGRISAPGEGKAAAYLESLDLAGWVKAMVFAARPKAPVVMIHRAAELARILAAFDKQTGEITVLPIASKPGEEARRVLVRGRKGLKRGPVRLLAPLVTHEADGSASPALDAVRRGEGIDW